MNSGNRRTPEEDDNLMYGIIRTGLKINILVLNQGGAELQPAGILEYV